MLMGTVLLLPVGVSLSDAVMMVVKGFVMCEELVHAFDGQSQRAYRRKRGELKDKKDQEKLT